MLDRPSPAAIRPRSRSARDDPTGTGGWKAIWLARSRKDGAARDTAVGRASSSGLASLARPRVGHVPGGSSSQPSRRARVASSVREATSNRS